MGHLAAVSLAAHRAHVMLLYSSLLLRLAIQHLKGIVHCVLERSTLHKYFVQYDVTVSFLAQVSDTVTYFVSQVLVVDTVTYFDIFW